MNVQLTVVQLWALVAGGPIAMILTVLVGILVNNAVTGAKIDKIEGIVRAELQRVEGSRKRNSLPSRQAARNFWQSGPALLGEWNR
jgi:hypothetical protein